jgi:hypothetical protein
MVFPELRISGWGEPAEILYNATPFEFDKQTEKNYFRNVGHGTIFSPQPFFFPPSFSQPRRRQVFRV